MVSLKSGFLVVFTFLCVGSTSAQLQDGKLAERGASLKKIGNRFYSFTKGWMGWHEASRHCTSRGLQLLSIETREEFDAIGAEMKQQGFGKVWTSASDFAHPGTHTWGTGAALTLGRDTWREGQPDFWQGEEHCIELAKWGQSYLLNDVNCNELRFVYCELPATCWGSTAT